MSSTEKKPFDREAFEKQWKAEGEAARAWAAENLITVTKAKIFLAGSEETTCFVADVCRGGFVIGKAQNDGHGGGSYFHPVGSASDEARALMQNPLLERFVDDTIDDLATEKELQKAVTSLRSKARKKGARTFGFHVNRTTGEVAAVWSGNPDPSVLSAKNPNYTVEVL